MSSSDDWRTDLIRELERSAGKAEAAGDLRRALCCETFAMVPEAEASAREARRGRREGRVDRGGPPP